MFLYSPGTRGFYRRDLHAAMPPDVVEVSAERHAELFDGQASGLEIVPGVDGQPVLQIVQPTPEERLAGLRRNRDRLLAASDFTQMPDVPLSLERRGAWATYRQALRDLPENITDPASIDWPLPPTA